MGGYLRFSGIDRFSRFLAIAMGGNSKQLTAFVIPRYGVLAWNYMPFGLQEGRTYSKLM
jgi:hypothetical protein